MKGRHTIKEKCRGKEAKRRDATLCPGAGGVPTVQSNSNITQSRCRPISLRAQFHRTAHPFRCQQQILGPQAIHTSVQFGSSFGVPMIPLLGSVICQHDSCCPGKHCMHSHCFIVKDTNGQPGGDIPGQPMLKWGVQGWQVHRFLSPWDQGTGPSPVRQYIRHPGSPQPVPGCVQGFVSSAGLLKPWAT